MRLVVIAMMMVASSLGISGCLLSDVNEPQAVPIIPTTQDSVDTTQSVETSIPQVGNVESNGLITEEQAKEIALTHAGVSSADAKFTQVKLELEKGVYEYDVEFYVGQKEYDYEINATTGVILGFDYEMETSIPQVGNVESNGLITEEQAKEIALTHASVSSTDAKFTQVKMELEKGVYEYDVEFYVGQKEYDYEINATTGVILGFDYEMETSIPQVGNVESNGLITEEQAKEIALTHAGVSSADAKFTQVKLELEKGIYEYEVEFYSGQNEYEYELNATTGTIISYDMDRR